MVLDLGSALQASRQALLTSVLPLFSSKTRVTAYHPQYLLTPLSINTLNIGPHSFPDTTLYSLEWDHNATPSPSPSPPPAPRPQAYYDSIVPRLNRRAEGDEELGRLIHLAGSNTASKDELVRLAVVIELIKKELDDEFGASEAKVQEEGLRGLQFASGSRAPPTRTNQFDAPSSSPRKGASSGGRRLPAYPLILVEFDERRGERYALPSHYSFTHTPAQADEPEQVRIDCFVFPGQRQMSVMEEQQMSSKGKGRELVAPPVPLTITVDDPSERARDALRRASRTARPRDEVVEQWWKQMLLSTTPQSVIEQPKPRSRSPSPELEEEPVMWRLSSFAKIDWVYDDDLVDAAAKKKPKGNKPKKTQASVALSRQGSKGVSSTPAGSATPEPAAASSVRGSSIAPASEPDKAPPKRRGSAAVKARRR